MSDEFTEKIAAAMEEAADAAAKEGDFWVDFNVMAGEMVVDWWSLAQAAIDAISEADSE